MADMTFDAIVVGGGSKTMTAAVYLAKYGKMKVGVFEERHELGGGWGTHEAPAPGFHGNTHASSLADWYYLPLQRDFPDIQEKGLKLLHQKVGLGIIMREDQSCIPFYHVSQDPTGEKTAKAVARCAGSRDGDTWWKLYEAMAPKGSLYDAWQREIFNLPSQEGTPGPFMQWFEKEMMKPGSFVTKRLVNLPANYACQELWDHPSMQYWFLRLAKAAGYPTESAGGPSLFMGPFNTMYAAFLQGGTHSAAHACQRVLLENGGKFFTKSEVTQIIVENGVAKGIRLADGTEIAGKVVVSGAQPYQTCFDLVGPDLIGYEIARKIAHLERFLTCITWYTWAIHESADYKAADYDPDINFTHWLVLASRDIRYLMDEGYMRRLGQVPPRPEIVNFHHHSLVDKTQSPEGKHVIGSEIHTVAAPCMSERQWMDYKKFHAEETMSTWQVYMKNMSWKNVIGYDSITPYDIAHRQANMAPAGNWNVLDRIPGQMPPFMPILEWNDHRIRPIKNLYGTGSGWGSIDAGHCGQGYTCYKAIAEDFDLAKPWEGQPW